MHHAIAVHSAGFRLPGPFIRRVIVEMSSFYGTYKTSFDVGVSDVRHAGAQRGEGDAALVVAPPAARFVQTVGELSNLPVLR